MKSIFEGNEHWQKDWRLVQRVLTPFDRAGADGCLFKREDAYAPLGIHGVNGSKVRMGVWWLDHMLRLRPQIRQLVFAGSVKSPLQVRVAALAAHFSLQSVHIIGATAPEKARRHEIIRSIEWLGGTLDCECRVAYNNALQKRARALAEPDDRVQVPYGLWLNRDHLGDNLETFYQLSALQLGNWPGGIRRLILPAGTFTTALAVFWGVVQNIKFGNINGLKHVEFPVIGPDHTTWFWESLADLLKLTSPAAAMSLVADLGLNVNFWHDKRMSDWNDMAKNVSIGDHDFHPSYEAKIVRWIRQENLPWLEEQDTCFWIIGADARLQPMKECEWRRVACAGL